MPTTTTAVILAAGTGSRLRPLTDDRPKALVPFGGATIVERAVRSLADYGVRRVILATGYREEHLRRALVGVGPTVLFCPNPDYQRTQNSVSLALCREAVQGHDFFKLDGDVVFEPRILERLDACGAPLSVAVDASRQLDAEAMKVELAEGERIVAFGKELAGARAAGESIGIERVSAGAARRLFTALDALLAAGRVDLYYEDVYGHLIAEGLEARSVDVSDLRWAEIDTPEDLARAEALFSGERAPAGSAA